jgi:thiol-disulfide isomerase/thioredoxin
MLELKAHHFDGQILRAFQNDVVIIAYTAEWCHFCQKLKNEYHELSKALINKAVVAFVDSDNSANLIEENNKFLFGYKVSHFPTIVIYKNGYMVSEYDGQRDKSSMLSAVKRYL